MSIGPPDALGLLVWAHSGLLMEMFGVGWLAASRLSIAWRRTLLEVAAFNLLHGVTLVIWSMYGSWPDAISITGNGILQITSYVMLWRAGSRIVGLENPDRVQAAFVLLPCLLMLGSRLSSADGKTFEAVVSLLTQGSVSLFASGLISARLWRTGQRGLAAMIAAVGLGMGLLLITWAVMNGWAGPDVAVQHSSAPTAYVSLVSTFVINVAIAYAVFGRQLRELERVTLNDAQTGLSSVTALEQSLAFELPLHAGRRRRLAVLMLAIDGADQLRVDWGDETFDAVVSETALQLRTRLSPGDVLTHAGQGRFVVALFDAGTQRAMSVARNLGATVFADASLHPDGHTRITLSLGVALSGAGSSPTSLLAEAARRCQQAQDDGGHRTVGGL
jgi:diguanylate cyclase (GGDEF)-like protein